MGHMIRSFACHEAERLFNDEPSRRLPTQIQRVARRKLLLLHQARRLGDLRVPPGNRLEALKGDRVGQQSIRINDQWRICFRWQAEDAFDVEIVDYH
jgi:proteic killer suppression protein